MYVTLYRCEERHDVVFAVLDASESPCEVWHAEAAIYPGFYVSLVDDVVVEYVAVFVEGFCEV